MTKIKQSHRTQSALFSLIAFKTIPLPLPSLCGADYNLPTGHLVHSTYHQALSAQSCTTQNASRSLYGLLGTLTPQILSVFQHAWNLICAFMLHSAALSWCSFPVQCKYMFRVVSEAHLARCPFRVVLCELRCTDVPATHYCTFIMFGKWRDSDSTLWNWQNGLFFPSSHSSYCEYTFWINSKNLSQYDCPRTPIPNRAPLRPKGQQLVKVNGKEEVTNCSIQPPPLSASAVKNCTLDDFRP